ncbi:unnamed protein product [Rotaria socialis]
MDTNVSNELASQSRSIVDPSLMETNRERPRKKNHGNKKLQRFRRRRRARGMSEATITNTIEARKREKEKQKSKQSKNITNLSIVPETNPMITTVSEIKQHKTNNNEMKRIASKNKRKRDISSFQLNGHLVPSISHGNLRPPVTKKIKRNVFNQCIPSNSISVNKQYPIPIYLTHSPHFIFQTLRQQFNRLLNKKDEQIFVHVRLQLLDRKYRLEVDQRLWQSYLDLGLKEKLWPRSLYEIAKTDQSNLCENYIMTQLAMIDDQLDQCNIELDKQAQSSIPILLPSLENMDKDLTCYVLLHQNYLIKRIDQQVMRYKDEIRDRQLYQDLFTYNLTDTQRHVLEDIIHLRLTQLQIYKEFTMLEQRILRQFLPLNFDQFENITAPDFYSPPIYDRTLVDMQNKRRTILKQGKRTLLNIFYAAYEYKVDEQEEQYQQSLNQFELQSCTRDQINGMSLIDYFKAYMLHHINQIIAEIFQKLTYFRLNMSHRYQRSSSVKAVVGVSPEVTIDILHCPFKPEELSHLSLCPSYIRSNQSALQPIKHRETQIKNNLKDIKDKVKRQLTNYCKREPPIARMNQYSELLEGLLRQHYLTSLSYADRMRAQREFQLVKSIRRKAQRAKLIIRVCDKGGGLHIGNKIDYERKAAKYRDDTKPYQELSYNPLMEIFTNVTNAINVLKNDKQLNLKNYNRLMPKRDDVSYPTTYIDKQFRKIFGNYITSNSILPLINNEHKFFQLRKEHMKQPTAQHSQVEARIALFEQNNIDNIVEDIIPMESTTTNKRKTNNVPDKVIIHYTHEKRFTTMKKDMHTIFEKSFEGYGLEAVRLIVGHRNSPNSERELIHKRPPLKYLTLKQ